MGAVLGSQFIYYQIGSDLLIDDYQQIWILFYFSWLGPFLHLKKSKCENHTLFFPLFCVHESQKIRKDIKIFKR